MQPASFLSTFPLVREQLQDLFPILLSLAPLFLFVIWFLGRQAGSSYRGEVPVFKPLLTRREQAMFRCLQDAFPNHAILAQISFGALLDARQRGVRNTFDRKIADFAICDKKTGKVLVLLELDDSSHLNKKDKDRARDKMLNRAGYTVQRYDNIPKIATLRSDLKKLVRC